MRNVLFLCTGNSARSIMAEAYLNHAGGGAWRAFSAGSHPKEGPNPLALETLRAQKIPLSGGDGALSSKSWDVFGAANAPRMDYVVTVCDNAAAETCPVWPTGRSGAPKILHWRFPDPAAAKGDDDAVRAAFAEIFSDIKRRIDALVTEEQS